MKKKSLSSLKYIKFPAQNMVQGDQIYMYVKHPIFFRVDPEDAGESWCQYLVLIQCFLTPTFTVFATSTALGTKLTNVYLNN